MADAAVYIEASDVFGLAGSFLPQSASRSTELAHAKMKSSNGDYHKFSGTFNSVENVSVVYKFNSDGGLGNNLPAVGSVENGYIVTSVSVSTTFDDYPEITVEGHQHAVNAHTDNRNEYSIPDDMKSILTGAVGAYDFSGLASDPTCVQTSTYTLAVNHVDAECGTGNHWVGQNVEGMESMEVNFIGLNTTYVLGDDWVITGYTADDSNDDFDTSSISAERLVLRDA